MLRSNVGVGFCRYSTQASQPLPISLVSIEAFQKTTQSNKTLETLRLKLQNGHFQLTEHENLNSKHLNSDRSLPMTKFPKQQIFAQVMKDDKVALWRKPIVKWIRLGIHMMKYYRDGLQNTYRIAKDTRNIFKQYDLDSKTPLVTQLCKLIEFTEIRHRLAKADSAIQSLVILTRKEFVEYHRRNQIWKLPTFFIIALVFEELTAVICYLFPKVAPHNCLTPGAFFKISSKHTNGNPPQDPLHYQSPYTLPKRTLFSILNNTAVIQVPKWKLKVYDIFDNRKYPSETLMQIHQYLFIDDWLLLQEIFKDGVTALSYRELVNCILERQLYSKEEDLNEMVNDETGRRILIWRLFFYWSFRFNGTASAGDEQLFSEKWGVNNVSILNYSGLPGNHLINAHDLSVLGIKDN